jgi:hypothetical protein
VLAVAMSLAYVLRAGPAAQQAAGLSANGPVRFSAVGIVMDPSTMGRIDIVIERWTTDAERGALLGNFVKGPQHDKLHDALQDVKIRTGYIKTSQRPEWDLRYARDTRLPDGTRQIVIATDRPVTFWAARTGARAMDYPFTLLELRMKDNEKGEGRMLAQTSIAIEDGRLVLENYSREPVRLIHITEEK